MPLLEEKIEKLPTGGRRGTTAGLLTRIFSKNQAEKLGLIGEIKQEIAPLEFNQPDLKAGGCS
jgi:hypothetical protein